MMRVTQDRAALLLQVETYDLEGIEHYKLMLVWREDRHTIHEMHLDAAAVYANPQAGDRVLITCLMDTPLRVKPIAEHPVAGSQDDAPAQT